MKIQTVPAAVRLATERAEAAGFVLSCEPDVGRLLRVLVAAVRRGGTVLELGTGVGVSLAWMLDGLGTRGDVQITSVELDPETAPLVARADLPPFVSLETGDALDILRRGDRWDLIFADAQGGKWEGLDDTIDALLPGGMLLVDDMTPPASVSDFHRQKMVEVREKLLNDPRLVSVELAWASGLILCTRV